MLKPKSWEVCQGLFLVCHAISVAAAPPPPPEPTHHIVVIDCSGSMASELPRIREQLNTKLVSLLGEQDAISIIWFSGRGECDVLLEAVQPSLTDLANIRRAVDRWLRPVGLTGFKEPIERAGEVMRRLKAKGGPARRTSFFFMSDGCDNIWPRPEILKAVDAIRGDVAAATVVEYGYYADSPFLTKMAERLGGSLIMASDFSAYEPVFAAAMARKGGSKKITVALGAEPVGDFAFAVDKDELLTFSPDAFAGKAGVAVPTHLTSIFYLSPVPVGEPEGRLAALAFSASKGAAAGQGKEAIAAAYAAMSLFAQRVKPTIVWSLLRALGDVALIDDFGLCFGKQRYAAFVALCRTAALGGPWFAKGYDPKRAPRADAFTVLDLTDMLGSDSRCRVLTDSDAFQYTRIGRKSVTKDLMLTVGEADVVKGLAEELAKIAEGRLIAPIQEHLTKITEAVSGRKKTLKFHVDAAAAEAGYPIDGIVWKGDLPNVSIRVKRPGTVDLSGVEMSAEVRAMLPPALKTFQYKSYAMVKDGLVHIEWLPVILPREKYDVLVAVGAIDPSVDPVVPVGDDIKVVIDVRKLPVINQRMVGESSARTLAEMAWEEIELKAAAKVFGHYAPERESRGFDEAYGPAATTWLKDHDVTEGNGFSPEDTRAPATDYYVGRSFKVRIPGFSSLPSVEDVRERMGAEQAPADGKKKGKAKGLTASAAVMVPFIKQVDSFLTSPEYTSGCGSRTARRPRRSGASRRAWRRRSSRSSWVRRGRESSRAWTSTRSRSTSAARPATWTSSSATT